MKNLLVPVDFSEVTARLVSVTVQLAHAFGAKVWLLHCVAENQRTCAVGDVPTIQLIPSEPLPERFPDEHLQLSIVAKSLANQGVHVETIFVSGVPIDAILAAANQHRVDLIIVGSHGHGVLYELLVGTVAKFVLLNAGRPTLIIPSRTHTLQKSSHYRPRKMQDVGQLEFTKPEFFGLSN